jgi:hypothetical protein
MGANHPARNPAKCLASCPRNFPVMAAAMPPDGRRDDSQDNLPSAGFGRAMTAPETGETTRNLAAQQLASSSWNFAVSF